ncbi:MAG: MgtC/SapB family protein [Sphingomonadales bacterium]|nr:MgtC/SapB family protein [Sphingomonadales bacterium]MDE2170925.1 MgtC/SapB family protein [Sphingomonadales bacterium]
MLIALGIGLLIGAERERRKAERPAAAGLRSFTIAALLGAGAAMMPQPWMTGLAMASITALALISSWRRNGSPDPGITTEIALVATGFLGAMSVTAPQLAGALAVLITIVLAARGPLHRFVDETVSAGEVADVLLLAGATLVVLPLLPDRPMGPFGALNPHAIWLVVVMILAINTAGQLATRMLGARLGVPLLGMASGFVSSSATIGAMGTWVRANPGSLAAGTAAAVLSTVANYVQMAVVIGVTDQRAFAATIAPVLAAALTALAVGAWFTAQAWRDTPAEPPKFSRSFNLVMALVFAAMLAVMLVASSALRLWFGETGLVTAAAISGVLDVHAAVISVAAQVADGTITPHQSVIPILTACSTSTLAKMLFSAAAGTRPFALRVMPAQMMMIGAAWAVALLI